MELLQKIIDCFNFEVFTVEILKSFKNLEVSCKDNNSISILKNEIKEKFFLSDIELINLCLPKDLSNELLHRDFTGQQSISFALRYICCNLNNFFHKISLENENDWNLSTQLPEEVTSLFQEFIANKTLPQLPIFGFSALGLFLDFRKQGTCRAFDSLTIKNCQQKTSHLFCSHHLNEAWWNPTKNQSTQATMYEFYFHKKNIDHWNEQELRSMVTIFWEKYQKVRTIEKKHLDKSLNFYGFPNEQELITIGQKGLQKKYFDLSLKTHPDLGGHSIEFIEVKEHYAILTNFLKLHLKK